ncbi:MAG TPA: ester cyclase [Polyangiaceae bacterium]|nr:ester cyclase [Polyangiaceae bacterium]
MNLQANKSIAQKYVDALDRHDVDGAVALCAPDFVNHAAIPEAQGTDGLRRILGKLLKAFPDHRISLDDVIAEGNQVVCRTTMRGTHTGPLEFVRWPTPATGRSLTLKAIHIFRVEHDKIVEHWAEQDLAALMRQLGATPRVEAHS